MTDRELLRQSARAIGVLLLFDDDGNSYYKYPDDRQYWNPLTDDGDALRLAVKLGISILPYPVYKENDRHSVIAKQRRMSDTLRESNPTEVQELYGNDPYAATRRAIVRAAAEIGKGME